jgi:hypothetical protein
MEAYPQKIMLINTISKGNTWIWQLIVNNQIYPWNTHIKVFVQLNHVILLELCNIIG